MSQLHRHKILFYAFILVYGSTAAFSGPVFSATSDIVKTTPVVRTLSTTTQQHCVPIPIIMYHYVENIPAKSHDWLRQRLNTPPAVLEAELQALQTAGYQTYFVNDIPTLISNPAAKPIILTFDDGYDDFYTNVFPLLQKYNMKATMYIVYNLIGRPQYMTQEQIQEIMKSGFVELGSHSMDHIDLGAAPLSKSKSQIFSSKQKLEQLFNVPVTTFAFPSGRYNTRVLQYVRDAGYVAAASTIAGICQSNAHIDLLRRYRASLFTPKNIISRLQHFQGLLR